MGNTQLRYLSKENIIQLNVSMEEAVNIVEQTYIAHASDNVHLPAKIGIHPSGSPNFFHAMPAMVGESNSAVESAGVKWVSYFPGNMTEKKISDSSCVMILNDVETGLPYCIMEGMHLTYLRTAASGAISAKRFANPEARVLGIIGAGEIARWSVHAITSIMPSIKEIKVISRTEESKNRFCKELSEQYENIKFTPSPKLEKLISDSDIALSITSNTAEPFINFDWLNDGALALALDGLKSWDSSFENADFLITDDEEYLKTEIERKHPNLNMNKKMHEISEFMTANYFEWSKNKKNIVFMNGVGSTDVTIAKYIYDQAVKNNVGTILPF